MAALKDNYLIIWDLKTGNISRKIFLSNSYKFTTMDMLDEDNLFVLESTKKGRDSFKTCILIQSNTLKLVAHLDYRMFGEKGVRNISISQGIIFRSKNNSVIEIFSLDDVLETQEKVCPCDLNEDCHLNHGLIGQKPVGIPVNYYSKEINLPPLFVIKCEEHSFSPVPGLCIFTPPKEEHQFHVMHISNPEVTLEMGTEMVDQNGKNQRTIFDQCFFHPDGSGKIMFITNNTLSIVTVEGDENSLKATTLWNKCFKVEPQQSRVQGARTSNRVTAFKGSFCTLPRCLLEMFHDSVLNLMIVHTVDPEDHSKSLLHLYDSDSLELIRTDRLPTSKNYHPIACNIEIDYSNGRFILVETDKNKKNIITVLELDRNYDNEKPLEFPKPNKKASQKTKRDTHEEEYNDDTEEEITRPKKRTRGVLGLLVLENQDEDDSEDTDFEP